MVPSSCEWNMLLDHFVRPPEQRGRDRQAERLGILGDIRPLLRHRRVLPPLGTAALTDLCTAHSHSSWHRGEGAEYRVLDEKYSDLCELCAGIGCRPTVRAFL